MVDADKEKVATSTEELTKELEHSQEVIETFQAALAELQELADGDFGDFYRLPGKKEYRDEMHDIFEALGIYALNFELHFLQPFQRLIRRAKRHFSTVAAQIANKEINQLIKELEQTDQKLQAFITKTEQFQNDCLNAYPEVMFFPDKKKEEETIRKKVLPYAQESKTEIPRQLFTMRSIIDKIKALLRP